MKKILIPLLIATAITQANGAIILFDLLGKAGPGLLAGNETGTVNGSPGSGGEVGAGIFFDDALNVLTLNVGWGSGQGFTDLTGPVTASHLHGPTPSTAPTSFNEATSPNANYNNLPSLPGFSSSAVNGGFASTPVTIQPGDVSALLAGRFYLNAHTTANGGGEIRGNLVAVPEPSTYALFATGALGFYFLRRRNAAK